MLVFDTGPLSAFALVERLDLLETRYSGNVTWAIEVRDEIQRGTADLAELAAVLNAAWLGDPIRLSDPEDLALLELFRWALGGSRHDFLSHRGEAATVAIALRNNWTAVLDDLDARRLAKAKDVEILGTLGILKAVARDGAITSQEAWRLFVEMRRLGAWLPAWVTPEFFEE